MRVNICQVCQSQIGSLHVVREMMLGTRDEFRYWECSECGCLSLTEIPEDLGRYYPHGYYSLKDRTPSLPRKIRDALYLSPLSFLVNWRRRTDLDVIRNVRLTKSMQLLDVGCGGGSLLSDLRELGYNARGVDPFVAEDLRDRFGIRVQRKTLAEVDEKYDVILFRHSLEHMAIDMLKVASERLKSTGVCVVCIPLLGWAWQRYKSDWVQLDAPRHFFLHSRKSFTLLAEESGFRVERVVYDSNEFQFWGSLLYQRNDPLSKMTPPNRSQRRSMRRLAGSLNARELGDTAQFYLRLADATPSTATQADSIATL